MDARRFTSWTSEASCCDSRVNASESGGARMLRRARVADMLRRMLWSRGSGACVAVAALRGRDGSERYDGGSASR